MLPIARVSILITPTHLFDRHWTGVDIFSLVFCVCFLRHTTTYANDLSWKLQELQAACVHANPVLGSADVGAGERLLSRALACCL